MPARGRQVGVRNKDSRSILDAVRTFLETHRRNVTVRMCLYYVVSLGLISTVENHEIKFYGLLSRARVAGEIDDEPFVDNHCSVEEGGNDGWLNIDQYMRGPDPHFYHRDHWQDQPKHPTEIWLEKNTIADSVRAIARKWDSTLRIASGAWGRAFLYRAAKELSDVTKPITILWCGDCDPAGWDIERAARKGNNKEGDRRREGLGDILIKKFDWTAKRFANQVKWLRVAATAEDLKNPNLQKYTIPVKSCVRDPQTNRVISGDTRSPAYVQLYGIWRRSRRVATVGAKAEARNREMDPDAPGSMKIAETNKLAQPADRPTAIDPADILDVKQLAKRLRVKPSWILERTRKRARIRDKHPLPCIHIGRYPRFRWSAVSKWLIENER